MKLPFGRRTTIVFVFLFLIAILALVSVNVQKALEPFLDTIAGFISSHPFWGGFIFLFLGALSAIVSPFSSVPLVPSAIMAWGIWPTFFLLILGWFLGDIAAYFIGSYASRLNFFKKWIPFDSIDKYRGYLAPSSEFLAVLGFRLTFPSEVGGYLLGIIKYDFWKYVLATLLAEAPFAAAVAFAGRAFNEQQTELFILWAGGLALFVFLMYRFFQKRIKPKTGQHINMSDLI